MKKHLPILFLTLILLLTACHQDSQPSIQNPTTPPPQQQIDEQEAQYQLAVSLYAKQDWPAAIDALSEIPEYKDSATLLDAAQTFHNQETQYQRAISLFINHDWPAAINALSQIPDYKDAAVLLDAVQTLQAQETAYATATEYLQSNQFREAAMAFESAGTYPDAAAQAQAAWYQEGILQESANNLGAAAIAFGKAGDHLDAESRSFSLWDKVAVRKTFDADSNYTLMIREDDVLVYTWNQARVKEYTDMRDVAAITNRRLLCRDGTVFALDLSYGVDVLEPTPPLSHDIVAISGRTLLQKDGTVLEPPYDDIPAETPPGWTDIIAISGDYTLDMDGTIHYIGPHDEFWEDMEMEAQLAEWNRKHDFIAISNSRQWFAAVTTDGKVCATHLTDWSFDPHHGIDYESIKTDHLDENGMVIGWDNVVDVSVSTHQVCPFMVALHSDGTVSAIGSNLYGPCNVENWTDIVAIDTGSYHTVGMKSDGTMVATGASDFIASDPLCSDDPQCFRDQCEVAGQRARTDTRFVSP